MVVGSRNLLDPLVDVQPLRFVQHERRALSGSIRNERAAAEDTAVV